MKTANYLLLQLLLPFTLVGLVAIGLIYVTQNQLSRQFSQTLQAQQSDLQVLADAGRFVQEMGQVQRRMTQALDGALDGSLDELQLYRMHSMIVNDLHGLHQQIKNLSGSKLVQESNHGSAAGLLSEFDNYQRFVIMSTDVLAVDPQVAGGFLQLAQRHYNDFSIFAARIEQRLTHHAQERSVQQNETYQRLAARMWAIGLGVLGLALAVSYLMMRHASSNMKEIAEALAQLVNQPDNHPNLRNIKNLHQRAHGPIRQMAGAVLAFRDALVRQQHAEEKAFTLAFYDPLTHLPNRCFLSERLGQALAHQRQGAHMALLVLDLDGFKHINDMRGHSAGDQALKDVAARLRQAVVGCEVLARTGGNTFAILLCGLDSDTEQAAQQAARMANCALECLAQPLSLGLPSQVAQLHYISAGVGITLFKAPLADLDQPLQHAEIAMHQAKSEGPGLVRFFNADFQTRLEARLLLENDLRSAVERGELFLHYQLQVDANSSARGVEALVRWKHPERGMVPPIEFIPLAEASDLILPVGQWVLEQACQQLNQWSTQPQRADLSIAVNVSAKQFRQPQFVQQVREALSRSGAAPQRLKLELTESLVLENVEETIEKMSELRALGVSFSMDDFGTGYSSLQYLKRLPLDQLKIERSFVRDIAQNSNDAAIVKTIIAMGRSLGLEVIAEGVETEEQKNFLRTHGCEIFQGYLFARPLPLEELEKLLDRNCVLQL